MIYRIAFFLKKKLRRMLELRFWPSMRYGNIPITYKIILSHNSTVIMLLRYMYIQ